jgi:hypothetical protein
MLNVLHSTAYPRRVTHFVANPRLASGFGDKLKYDIRRPRFLVLESRQNNV